MKQRYQAVLAVIADGRGVGEVAAQFGVSRQSVHAWLRRYEDHGLEGLANRSHNRVRPLSGLDFDYLSCRGSRDFTPAGKGGQD